jgi:flagellar hook-associated protein 1 FlgK
MAGGMGSILSMASSALRTQQAVVAVHSNNIANAQTEGYTRQKALLSPLPSQFTPQGIFGTGVTLTNIQRVRDTLLDASFRGVSQQAATDVTRQDILSRVEEVMAEPTENGLAATLDRFYSAWGDLANSPTSLPAKGMVQQRGTQLVQSITGMDAKLQGLSDEVYKRINDQVTRVNDIANQIAALNGQIVPAESGGQTAGGLRDTRDQLIDELSQLAGTQVVPHADGSVGIVVADQTIVDTISAKQFNAANLVSGQVQVTIGASGEAVQKFGGSIGALLGLMNTEIATTRSHLDNVATALTHGVNQWHRTGWSAAGDAANLAGEDYDTSGTPAGLRGSRVDFFLSPSGTTPGATPLVKAHDLALDPFVAGDARYIAAGRAGWNGTAQVPAAGDNSIALAMAALRTTATTVDDTSAQLTDPPAQVALAQMSGKTTAEYWREVVSRVGADVARTASDATVSESLAGQAETRRQSVAGVSIDEELIGLMRAQQSYQAASRVISTVNEMMGDLLSMVR